METQSQKVQNWDDTNWVELPENAFQVAVYPVIAIKNVPAGRGKISYRYRLNAMRRVVKRVSALTEREDMAGHTFDLPSMDVDTMAAKNRLVGFRVFYRTKPVAGGPSPLWRRVTEFQIPHLTESAAELLSEWNAEEEERS